MDLANFKIYFLFVITLIAVESNAQLLDTNTIWSERGSKFSYVVDDTVSLNNQLYHRINRSSDTTISYSNSVIETFLVRTEGDSVLRYDAFNEEELLIYDFSLEVGDSIYVYPYSNSANDSVLVRCENVDIVSLMGVQRRRLEMKTLEQPTLFNLTIEYWYWGIGSDLGVLNPGRLAVPLTLDEYMPELWCCHKSFVQVYQKPGESSCYNVASIEEYEQSKVILYPNPISSGEPLTVEIMNKQIDELKVFDIQGKKVYETIFNATTQSTILKGFESGLYIILFYGDSNVLHREKLVVK
jgi:hypothetical protein